MFGNLKNGFWHFLILRSKLKTNLDFQRIFDIPLAEYLIPKKFLECIGYISNYLLNSEQAQ